MPCTTSCAAELGSGQQMSLISSLMFVFPSDKIFFLFNIKRKAKSASKVICGARLPSLTSIKEL